MSSEKEILSVPPQSLARNDPCLDHDKNLCRGHYVCFLLSKMLMLQLAGQVGQSLPKCSSSCMCINKFFHDFFRDVHPEILLS